MTTQPSHKAEHVPTLADVAALHTAAQLSGLLDGPSPTNSAVAAVLLHRWLDAVPMPETQGHIRAIGIKSTVFYLQWVTASVGAKALEALTLTDRDVGHRFVDAFTAHANERIRHYQNACFGGVGAQVSEMIARHWRQVKLRVLGQSLVIDGHRIERPPYRLRYTWAQRQKR